MPNGALILYESYEGMPDFINQSGVAYHFVYALALLKRRGI